MNTTSATSQSWLSQNYQAIVTGIKEHIPEAQNIRYDAMQDRLDCIVGQSNVYYIGSEHIDRQTFITSFNTDLVGINIFKQLDSGQLTKSYLYDLVGSENSRLIVQVGRERKSIELNTDEKIYDYATGVFDFAKFEKAIIEKFPMLSEPSVSRGVTRGFAPIPNTVTSFKIPFLPL